MKVPRKRWSATGAADQLTDLTRSRADMAETTSTLTDPCRICGSSRNGTKR